MSPSLVRTACASLAGAAGEECSRYGRGERVPTVPDGVPFAGYGKG